MDRNISSGIIIGTYRAALAARLSLRDATIPVQIARVEPLAMASARYAIGIGTEQGDDAGSRNEAFV